MSEAIEAVVVPSEAIQKVDNVSMAIDRAPQAVLSEAHQAAKALQDVVSKKHKKVMFNGEQYLEFEDLQTLGRFYGVTAGQEGDSEFCNIGGADGAKAQAVAMRGGQVISRATAYCMRDEPNWKAKPWFQLASMAQTRANAKVLRNVLAWVVVLAGYKATPAEEMDGLASVSPAATHAIAAPPPPKQPTRTPQPTPAAPPIEGLQLGEEFGMVEKLSAVKMGGAKKDKPFRVFTFNGKSVFCWDKNLHQFLGDHADQSIYAVLETKNNFTSLISCRADAPAPAETFADGEPVPDEIPF